MPPASDRGAGRSGAPIVAPAPTSATTTPIPGGPPFTHFPTSRADHLAGEPVPMVHTAEAVAAMPMHALRRRLKVLASMRRMTRLGRPFVDAARTESLDLGNELVRRVRAQVLAAEAEHRASRKATR